MAIDNWQTIEKWEKHTWSWLQKGYVDMPIAKRLVYVQSFFMNIIMANVFLLIGIFWTSPRKWPTHYRRAYLITFIVSVPVLFLVRFSLTFVIFGCLFLVSIVLTGILWIFEIIESSKNNVKAWIISLWNGETIEDDHS